MEWLVQTQDGRSLSVEDAGDPDGLPVMVHVGTPSSRQLYGRTVTDAKARGIRLISYDRPGYGTSTPQPRRTIADTAGDARTICEALDIGRLAMWGYSGGGPPLLACAALLPDLVVAAASLASSAPYDAQGLDWLAGMGPDAADWVTTELTDWPAAVAEAEQERTEMLAKSPAELAASMGPARDAADAAFLLEEAICMQQGYAPGIHGCLDDNLAQVLPWGFDVSEIAIPMLLLHGRRDESVPFAHGEWLAAHIPGVEARLLDDEDHTGIRENRIGEVHAWLVNKFLFRTAKQGQARALLEQFWGSRDGCLSAQVLQEGFIQKISTPARSTSGCAWRTRSSRQLPTVSEQRDRRSSHLAN